MQVGSNEFTFGSDRTELYNVFVNHGEALLAICKDLTANYAVLEDHHLKMLRFCIECFEMGNSIDTLDYFSDDILADWVLLFATIIKYV